ncbi:MAG: helix-turn-helix domain-containing protein [Leadbetterella sp.]|nr:helix-turn-helix domain-containing protein [Leadbetterella sp.]
MSRKLKYIKLTESERTSLLQGHRSGKTHLYRRHCEAILMSDHGKSIKEISAHFKVRISTVGTWLTTWQHFGIDGLKLSPGRGRKPILSESNVLVVTTIENLLQEESRHIHHIVTALEDKHSLVMCAKTLKRFLKKKVQLATLSQNMSQET